jgi:uncharacterized membrane protein
MAACSKCGSVVSEGAVFCSGCGSPVSAGSSPVAVPPPPQAVQPPPPSSAAGTGLSSNVAAALSYLLGFITGIIFLVMEPYKRDPFVRFHAFQSIFFSIAMFVLQILWSIVMGALFTLGMWGFFSLISTLFGLAVFLLWLFLMFKAYNNERFMIPFIGDLASKQSGK